MRAGTCDARHPALSGFVCFVALTLSRLPSQAVTMRRDRAPASRTTISRKGFRAGPEHPAWWESIDIHRRLSIVKYAKMLAVHSKLQACDTEFEGNVLRQYSAWRPIGQRCLRRCTFSSS